MRARRRVMEITEVRISPSKGGKVKAFASFVIDDSFIVNDLRIMEGRDGQVFVTMPARKIRNGQMRDIAHPLNSDTRKLIEEQVLQEYHQAVASRVVPANSARRDGGAKRDKLSPLDALAGRLFAEEFWTADSPQVESAED